MSMINAIKADDSRLNPCCLEWFSRCSLALEYGRCCMGCPCYIKQGSTLCLTCCSGCEFYQLNTYPKSVDCCNACCAITQGVTQLAHILVCLGPSFMYAGVSICIDPPSSQTMS
jgi:hypothetical protein